MRYCLNVHGVMLCDGPQHHEGGCTFTQGWQLARKLEDELASIAGYAGDTTNELRETRERAEAAEAEVAQLRDGLRLALTMIERAQFDAHDRDWAREQTTHLRALAEHGSPACDHEWVSARNEVVTSGLICRKCLALSAEHGSPEEARP